jgi:hypothetical protein
MLLLIGFLLESVVLTILMKCSLYIIFFEYYRNGFSNWNLILHCGDIGSFPARAEINSLPFSILHTFSQ